MREAVGEAVQPLVVKLWQRPVSLAAVIGLGVWVARQR
jgi:hypothetical protein